MPNLETEGRLGRGSASREEMMPALQEQRTGPKPQEGPSRWLRAKLGLQDRERLDPIGIGPIRALHHDRPGSSLRPQRRGGDDR